MSVCNVRVADIRPQYQNLEEWCKDPNNVYIGRARNVIINGKRYPDESSIWANPFRITKYVTREQVLKKYRAYITSKIEQENLIPQLKELKGKRLGCWCHPEPCHGHILLELIEKIEEDERKKMDHFVALLQEATDVVY